MATAMHPPVTPTAYMHFDVNEMITLTNRLSDILVEETKLLASMKVKEISPFQEEKMQLGRKLESFQRMLAADDTAARTLPIDHKEALLIASENLYEKIDDAMYRTSIAQQVNQRVMQVFVEAMAEQQRLGVYGNQGRMDTATDKTISVNLNERA